MIRLIDDYGYGIEVTESCYAIGKMGMQTNKKTGKQKEVFKTLGYYSSVQSALKGIRRHLHMEILREFDGSLKEAIEALDAFEQRFTSAISNINF